MIRRIVAAGLVTAGFLGVSGLADGPADDLRRPASARRSRPERRGRPLRPGNRRNGQSGTSDRRPQARQGRTRLRHAGREDPGRPLLSRLGSAAPTGRLRQPAAAGTSTRTPSATIVMIVGAATTASSLRLHAIRGLVSLADSRRRPSRCTEGRSPPIRSEPIRVPQRSPRARHPAHARAPRPRLGTSSSSCSAILALAARRAPARASSAVRLR